MACAADAPVALSPRFVGHSNPPPARLAQNDVVKDYVSEKVYDGILAGTLSVRYGLVVQLHGPR